MHTVVSWSPSDSIGVFFIYRYHAPPLVSVVSLVSLVPLRLHWFCSSLFYRHHVGLHSPSSLLGLLCLQVSVFFLFYRYHAPPLVSTVPVSLIPLCLHWSLFSLFYRYHAPLDPLVSTVPLVSLVPLCLYSAFLIL